MAKFIVEIESNSGCSVNALLEAMAAVRMRLVEKGAIVGEFHLIGVGLHADDVTFSVTARHG